MIKVIAINGAPGSGKDTFAESVLTHLRASMPSAVTPETYIPVSLSMKERLLYTVRTMFSIPRDIWWERYNDRERKEQPWSRLGGMSQREALIWMSEDVIKPKLGEDFFAKQVCTHIERVAETSPYTKNLLVIMPDAGFLEEQSYVVKHFIKDNYKMVNILREGYDFSKDSRSLVTGEDLGLDRNITVLNEGSIDDLRAAAKNFIKEEIEDWL